MPADASELAAAGARIISRTPPRGNPFPCHGWVLYDGQCALCIDLAQRFAPLLVRHGFDVAPLQTPWVQQRLGLQPDGDLTEMRLLTADGRTLGGADALIEIARRIWWAMPVYVIAQFPGIKPVLHAAYRWVAERRHCLAAACQRRKL